MCFECNEPCQGTSPRKTAHVITDLLRQNFITASAQTITRGRGTQNKQLRGTTNPPAFRTARDGGGDWATTREEQTKL